MIPRWELIPLGPNGWVIVWISRIRDYSLKFLSLRRS